MQERVMRWRPGKDGRGIGLVGPRGIGKRRLILSLAKELFLGAVRIALTTAIDFEKLTSFDQFDNALRATARTRINEIQSAPVLILADLGTERVTERGQTELYGLLEHRAVRLLPILWTSPFSKAQLAARYSKERAPLLIGRLEQCSEVIRVEREILTGGYARTSKALPA
jgi:DNA replication protein DnaC